MYKPDSIETDPQLDQEIRVRYVDPQGTYHEDRLHLLNLAAFILNSVNGPVAHKGSAEMRDYN